MVTDHLAFKTAFQKKDVNHRIARWTDNFAKYQSEIMERLGHNNRPANNLYRLRDLMSPNENFSEDIVGIVEVQVPNDYEYETSIHRLIKILDGLEMGKVVRKHRNWVCRNPKAFTWVIGNYFDTINQVLDQWPLCRKK